ncbi:MAG: TIGR04211 family SH3 domain-containing protein [Pseudomonadota bacterium]
MNINQKCILFIVAFFPLSGSLCAQETQYVTDRLQLGLYADENASGKRISILESGVQLKVLEQKKNYTKVETGEGAKGWVKSAYLISDEPAKVMLARLERENDKLLLALEESKRKQFNSVSSPTEDIISLKRELEEKNKVLQQAQFQINDLNRSLAQSQMSSDWLENLKIYFNPLGWYLMALLSLFCIGIILGIRIVNNRIHKRFYGFKLA